MKKGHVPVRTCIGCRKKFPKGTLIRFTLGSRGLVVGSGAGRGYYICANMDCLERALKMKTMSRLLGRAPVGEEAAELAQAIEERRSTAARNPARHAESGGK